MKNPWSGNIRKQGEEIVLPGENWSSRGTIVVEGCSHSQNCGAKAEREQGRNAPTSVFPTIWSPTGIFQLLN